MELSHTKTWKKCVFVKGVDALRGDLQNASAAWAVGWNKVVAGKGHHTNNLYSLELFSPTECKWST